MVATITRRNHGRGHSYYLDGQKVPGVTTIINEGLPKPALVNWAGDATADYAVNHWAELADMPVATRLAAIKRGKYEDRDSAVVRGLDVHALASRLVADEAIEVPSALAGHVEAYIKFLDEWEPVPVLAEAVVASTRYHYAGTLDLLAEMRDGRRWLVDIKTGKGVYPEAALQLSAYANCDLCIAADGQELAMPRVDALGVVHVRSDGYDVYPVPHEDVIFKAFRHVKWLAYLRAEVMPLWLGDALRVPLDAA